jgi:tetratricopeptide (TPR) repeat protein
MKRIYISLLLISVSIAACSGSKEVITNTPKATANSTDPYVSVSAEDSIDAKRNFLQGLFAYEIGDYDKALDLLTTALIKLPTSAGIHFALADAYMASEDGTNALYYINEAVKIEPKNKWYISRLADIYERTNQFTEAADVVKKLIKIDPSQLDHQYRLAEIYTKKGDLNTANDIYATMLNKYGTEEVIHYRRYINFAKMGDTDSAMVELGIITELNPQDISVFYSLVELQISAGKPLEAVNTLKKILEKNDGESQAFSLLIKLYLEAEMYDEVNAQLNEYVPNTNMNFASKEQMGRILLTRLQAEFEREKVGNSAFDQINEISKSFLTNITSTYPDEVSPLLFTAQYYMLLQNDKEALIYLKKALEKNDLEIQVWNELLQLYLRNSNFKEITEIADKADDINPDNAFIQYAAGVSYYSLKQYKNANKWFAKATISPARREFKSLIYSIMGDSYNELDNWPKAAESYEASIKLDPNNATALNNFAYYLSVRKEKLNEAKLMSKKSLDIEPENPSFLDTYGWILYQVGEYEDAKIYILKAIDVGGASAEVYEHLGDVYEKLENDTQAQKWWKIAFDLDPERTYLQKRFSDEL